MNRQEILQSQMQELKDDYQYLADKLKAIRKQRYDETRLEEKMRLDGVINDLEKDRGQIVEKMEEIHNALDGLDALTAPARDEPQTSLPREFRDKLKDGALGPVMIQLPMGIFLMGSPEDEAGRSDNEHQHRVAIEQPFAIGKYQVTFEEYDRFAEVTGREKPGDAGWGRGRRPVINVTWFDAMAYADWLSEQTGQYYRLPTEAEWEYAARAGTTTPYHFGSTISPEQANYGNEYGKTLPVGHFPANPWGLHDVHGNVWEWTCSEYDEAYGGAEQRRIRKNNASARRVGRGGGWGGRPLYVRSAARGRDAPGLAFGNQGFRLARA